MLRFKDLRVGEVFRFESEASYPEWGLCKGPWRKTSARKYESLDKRVHTRKYGLCQMVCTVGSINAEVVRAEED